MAPGIVGGERWRILPPRPEGRIVGEGTDAVPELVRLLQGGGQEYSSNGR